MTQVKKGKFIVVEGGDFSGKSTFVNKLKEIYPEFKYTREPGNQLDTSSATKCEDFREILLSVKMSPSEEALIFAKARELHTCDIVGLINQGHTIICDRYILSSFAYQAHAGDLGYYEVFKKNRNALEMLRQHNINIDILLFKISESNYLARKQIRQQNGLDIIEQKEDGFFNEVSRFFNTDIYLDYLPKESVNINIHEINADNTIDEVFAQGKEIVEKIINR